MIKFKNLGVHSKNLFITGCTHYNHLNICRGTTKWEGEGTLGCRDFDTLDEMNNVIINGINKYVKENDVLIHLGDVAFQGLHSYKEFTDRVNCKNIYLIQGNHDYNITFTNYLDYGFKEFNQLAYYSCDGISLFCSHYPCYNWHQSHKGSINLHSHTHNSFEHLGRGLDCGIDSAFAKLGEYKPFSLNEALQCIENKQVDYNSHHNSKTN